MLIIPAIDIIQEKVVRLQQGDFNKQKCYSDDPAQIACRWQEKGARFLHIVDLDGARCGKIKNGDVISRVIKGVDIPCEVGGGLRNDKDIEYFLKQGARRIVISTKAFEDMDYLRALISRFHEKIVVSIDFVKGYVAKTGWLEKTDLTPDDALRRMQEVGVRTIVVTDITRDGTLTGPNIDMLKKILESVDISVIASGGVSSLEDIKRLRELGAKNLEGVIIGRALYEGKIDLEKAIKAAL